MMRKVRYNYMLKRLFKTAPKLELEVERFKYSKKYGVYALIFVELLLQIVCSLNTTIALADMVILLSIVVLEFWS